MSAGRCEVCGSTTICAKCEGAKPPKPRFSWACSHCKTGIVYRLPSRCPECDKMLNEQVTPAGAQYEWEKTLR